MERYDILESNSLDSKKEIKDDIKKEEVSSLSSGEDTPFKLRKNRINMLPSREEIRLLKKRKKELYFRFYYEAIRKAYRLLREVSARAHDQQEARKDWNGGKPWEFYDSPLSGGYDSCGVPKGFNEEFEDVLDGHENIETYLKGFYGDQPLITLELGGSSRQLVKDLKDKGVRIESSAGVEIIDNRDENQKREDKFEKHDVIETDLFHPPYKVTKELSGKTVDFYYEGIKPVQEWLNKQDKNKCDLLVFRPVGPLGLFDVNSLDMSDADIYEAIRVVFLSSFLKWYTLLSEGGTILATLPNHVADKVKEMISEIDPEQILFDIDLHESQYKLAAGLRYEYVKYTKIRLRRLHGSPNKIKHQDLIG